MGASNLLDVTLETDIVGLEQVVVVGYVTASIGQQRHQPLGLKRGQPFGGPPLAVFQGRAYRHGAVALELFVQREQHARREGSVETRHLG